MASPDLLAAAFADLTLGLPLSTLQLEGGDVIVRLSERRDDVLLLHSKVLGAASERFQARFGSRFWEPTREVPDKTTGETVRVYEYRLIHADQTFVLSDEKESPGQAEILNEAFEKNRRARDQTGDNGGERVANPRGTSLQFSQLSEGFAGNYAWEISSTTVTLDTLHAQLIRAHKVLFAFVYKHPLDADFEDAEDAVHILTEVLALAEYYLLLPHVANRITTELIARPGLWKSISQKPTYFLRISTKLRFYPIFADAMRHIVGRTFGGGKYVPQNWLHDIADTELELMAYKLARVLDWSAGALREAFARLTLSYYRNHATAPTVSRRGLPVRTTWYAEKLGERSVGEKARWIAASMFREKWEHLLHGDSHWSHVEWTRAGRKGGEVDAGKSLYEACKAILAADASPNPLELFGQGDPITHFATNFLDGAPTKEAIRKISKHLRALLRDAAGLIQEHRSIPGFANSQPNNPDQPHRARYEEDLGYFTDIGVNLYDVSWADLIDRTKTQDEHGKTWPESDVEVEEASDEWMALVGV